MSKIDRLVTVTKDDIVQGLRKLGLKEGDIVLVHSSLSSFGYVEGGIEALIDGLLETVRSTGTVVVPTLTGSEKLSSSNPPVFDVVNTPCWTGKVPEAFRKRKEAKRSLHPTHSVAAIGPMAETLIKDHEKAVTPCGINTPYERIAELGGYVLLIGVDQNRNTTFHTAEEIAEVPYHIQPDLAEAKIIAEDGREIVVPIKLHRYGPERDFNIMEDRFKREGIMKIGKIGKSTIRLLKAKEMIEAIVDELRKDPNALFGKRS